MTLFDVTCNRCRMFQSSAVSEDITVWMADHGSAHDEIDAQKVQLQLPQLPKVMPARVPRKRKEEKAHVQS